jgi:prepilin-type N-terminal cleavage/methylation domain-containing protein
MKRMIVVSACDKKASFTQYSGGGRSTPLLFQRFVFFNSCRRAFTMIELIVTVAILSTLAALIVPRISWMEPPQRTLQRAFIEAVDLAQSGISIRFRVDKEENIGAIICEVLVKEETTSGFERKVERVWKTFDMRWKPTGKEWAFEPEIIYFYQNGMCTTAKITWGKLSYSDNYLLTVTGFLVETNKTF